MNKYQELRIWNKSMDLVEQVYMLTNLLPDNEKFGLISQIKICSISIPSNIAEGAGRNSNKEFIHFLNITNGSTCELETQLLLTIRLKMLSKDKVQSVLKICNEIGNMNFALQKSLKS